MLADVVDLLACPACGGPLVLDGRAVRCGRGHASDVARQGYVNLLGPRPGRRGPAPGDTPAMVAARAAVHEAGALAPLTSALAAAAPAGGTRVLDVGAGTGHHLAAVLDALPGAVGLAVDTSTAAVRRAARCHARAGAVVADAWRALPVRDGAVDLALVVFAPRPGAELARVVAPGGAVLVAIPGPDHLAGLVDALPGLGLLRVDRRKDERVAAALGPAFEPAAEVAVDAVVVVDREVAAQLVLMGPSAFHVDEAALRAGLAELPDPLPVRLAVRCSTWRRRA